MKKAQDLCFGDDFEPVTPQSWRALVERDLKGASFDKRLVSATEDGIRVEPIYTAADAVDPATTGLPGAPPYARGSRAVAGTWDLRERVEHLDVELAAEQARTAVERGATSLWIVLDAKARAGRDWDHVGDLPASVAGGVMLSRLAQLERLLRDVDLAKVAVALDAGAGALPAAALFIALCRQRGIALDQLRGGFDADPLGALAADGRLVLDLERALALSADLACWTVANAPGVRAVTVSTLPYHDAGASAAQELAVALATGVTYLRRLTAAGLGVDAACSQLSFRFSAGRDVFAEIAKLRAARLCWSRLVQACGGADEAQRMPIHACTAWRTKTQYDPWVNMLRATVETFSAAVGGADVITTSGFDEVLGSSDELARRVARNTQIILQDEAYVGRVTDPAGGSWYVESLTRKLAETAWRLFQQIEAEGGMASSLTEGHVQRRIEEVSRARRQQVAKRKQPITGVSEFPHVHEQPLQRRAAADITALREQAQQQLQRHLEAHEQQSALAALAPLVERADVPAGALTAKAIEAVARGATLGRIAEALGGQGEPSVLATPLPRRRDAESFEQLRVASDAFVDLRGERPRVFLANMGPIPQHRARAEFSSNFFQVGGFEPLINDGFDSVPQAAREFAQSKAPVAVICSTDEDYRARAAELARTLKEAGARLVVLAGRPGEQEQSYRAAGVDHFIFVGCDAQGTLRTLLQTLEVMQ